MTPLESLKSKVEKKQTELKELEKQLKKEEIARQSMQSTIVIHKCEKGMYKDKSGIEYKIVDGVAYVVAHATMSRNSHPNNVVKVKK